MTATPPVVLLIFGRPDTTAQVLQAIKLVEPRRLLVVANAPRADVSGEAERCEATRRLIDGVDWDCEVSTNYATEHMSQRRRIESGLDWAFGLTEEAIVLEDDCVPHPSFFAFCGALLDRYRDEDEVLSISGNNFQPERPASADSYYFSRYPHIWGWASWRRAWQGHDPEMSRWPELRGGGWLRRMLERDHPVAYWTYLFDRVEREDAWDRAWVFSCWLRGGLHAIPNVNLVTNVGFRDDATHTRPEQAGPLSEVPARPMRFPLRHPDRISRNVSADEYTEEAIFSGAIRQIFDRIRRAQGAGTPGP